MIHALLIASLIGICGPDNPRDDPWTACSRGAVGQPATFSIRLKFTVVQIQHMSINMEQLDPNIDDIFRVTVKAFDGHRTHYNDRYIVMKGSKQSTIAFQLSDQGLTMDHSKDMIVMREWEYDDLMLASHE